MHVCGVAGRDQLTEAHTYFDLSGPAKAEVVSLLTSRYAQAFSPRSKSPHWPDWPRTTTRLRCPGGKGG